jgi:hypothetical protein
MFVAFASIMNGLFILNLDDAPICNISAKRPRPNDLSPTYMWHYRLGHISENRMKKLHSDGLLTLFDFESCETCEACLLSKMTKAPFTGLPERALDLSELIHTVVCGPMSTTARGGFQYFITFTDDFSIYGYVYLMKHKSKSLEKFKEFHNEVENQHGKKIKALRSDCGGCGGQISPGSTRRLEDLAKGSGPNVSQGHPFVGLGRDARQSGSIQDRINSSSDSPTDSSNIHSSSPTFPRYILRHRN